MGILLQKIDRPMGNGREIVKIEDLNNCNLLGLYIKSLMKRKDNCLHFKIGQLNEVFSFRRSN